MKRYSMIYESDKINPFSNIGAHNHIYGDASTIKTAKQYINRCKKNEAKYNPRNFRIYDTYADVDPVTNYVPCIYRED